MNKVCILLSCLLVTFSGPVYGADPVRVTVDVKNSGEVALMYIDFDDTLPGDLHTPGAETDGSSSIFRLPDDGKIYFCFVFFYNAVHELQNMKILMFPGESILIEGELHDTHTDFAITGSEMFSSWAEHRNTYLEHEKMIIAENLDSCDPATAEFPEKLERYNELREKINHEMSAFIKDNPQHPLSAYYFGYNPDGDPIATYDMLTGRLKEGDYKRYLDCQLRNFSLGSTDETNRTTDDTQ